MQERPPFIDQLQAKWNEGKFVCVGLDADVSKLPHHLKNLNTYPAQWAFLVGIVKTTADTVLAYKPNIAFFEDDPHGEDTLANIVDHIHSQYPTIPVIGDVKRADIGNTNWGYARMAFERYDFDAITTNPYFGHDTYKPFLNYQGRGLLVLCKTSNPGASLYQDVPINIVNYQAEQILSGNPLTDEEFALAIGAANSYHVENWQQRLLRDLRVSAWFRKASSLYRDSDTSSDLLPLYQIIALRTSTLAKQNPNIGLVVGATHPESFAPVRRLFGDGPILIPGIGTQGGDLEKTLQYAPNSQGQGMIINSASKILFASSGKDFADAAGAETLKLHQQITALRRQNV